MRLNPLNIATRLFYRHGFNLIGAKKRALVSYVPTLPFWNKNYYTRSHNSKLTAYLLCKVLNSLGYVVDLRSCDDTNVSTYREYDFFLGHTKSFLEIKNKIILKGKAVLLVTGSSPEFGNAAQHARAEDLYQRRGIRLPVYSENIVTPARNLHSAADHILMLGNSFVQSTWYPEFQHKYNLINNVSSHQLNLGSNRTNGYLFFSSTGQVHRGLDLLLEVFSKRQENLHICSSVLSEKDFVSAFSEELFNKRNIYTHGFVNSSSEKFNQILSECKYVILPSCSEGQSSSVINAMFNGLLPIVTNNVGLPYVYSCGYLLDDVSPKGIHKMLDELENITEAEYIKKRDALPGYLNQFSPDFFKSSLVNFFLNTVGL